jgi:hypothetical protein
VVGFFDLFFDFEALEGFELVFGGARFRFVEVNAILMDVLLNFLDLLFIMIHLIPCGIERSKVLVIDGINVIPRKYKFFAGVEVQVHQKFFNIKLEMIVLIFPPQFRLDDCIAIDKVAPDFLKLVFIVHVVTCFVQNVTLLVGVLL